MKHHHAMNQEHLNSQEVVQFMPGTSVEMAQGTVQQSLPEGFLLQGTEGGLLARQAFSCMATPEIGDTVIYSRVGKQVHILSILERPTQCATELSFPNDLAINVKQGSVSINGEQGIAITSPDVVKLMSEDLQVHASKGLFALAKAQFIGNDLDTKIDRIRLITTSIDTIADRATQHLKNSFRSITGLDQTKAAEVITTAQKLFSVRGRQAAVLAEKDIKIDAKRIHMG